MKTNKINVVLSLNKTVVSNFENNWSDLTKVSGAACGAGGVGVSVDKVAATIKLEQNSYAAANHDLCWNRACGPLQKR